MTSKTIPLDLADEKATNALGATLAALSQPGDCILLKGHIGAGKSALARAFIRAIFGEETEVPSPTFTLVQTYETDEAEVWHADLYRLGDTQEAVELGLIDAIPEAICLIEWPEIIEHLLPDTVLTISMEVREDMHHAELGFGDAWTSRLSGAFHGSK